MFSLLIRNALTYLRGDSYNKGSKLLIINAFSDLTARKNLATIQTLTQGYDFVIVVNKELTLGLDKKSLRKITIIN